MFQLLKQIVLFFYFWFVRLSKQQEVLRTLIPKYRKREIDIPEIPAALDEIEVLPEDWQDNVSFVGFDNEGLCIRINAARQSDESRAIYLDLDIPGFGKFSYTEIVTNITNPGTKIKSCFEGRRIQMYCLDPMKRWKVQFRGPLDNINFNGKRVHATILLYWQCLFDPYGHLLSPSNWKLAGTLSDVMWYSIQALSVFERDISYEQWGELRGRINIETHDEQYIRLKCVRERSFNTKSSNNITFLRQHFVLKKSGQSFSQRIMKFCSKKLTYSGYVTYPIKDSFPTWIQNVKEISEYNKAIILKFPQEITACHVCYKICENLTRKCFGKQNSGFNFKTLTVNGKVAFGVEYVEVDKYVEDNVNTYETNHSGDVQPAVDLEGREPEVVYLDDPVCKEKYLVGGKACHLSALISLGKCNVPKGFCVTTKAYSRHIKESKTLEEAAKEIEECLKMLRVGKLKQKCDSAAKLLQQAFLKKELQDLIREHLEDLFGKEKWKPLKFAVRSSSVSEDCMETSGAGQMDSYLCIQGFDNIIAAIQRCWASSFTYQVVEYRRQNGQKLTENMGVIVQEMVDADVSGVVFTADPVTGSESNMVINAAFGLGESIVSGAVSPDTITVNRENEGKLHIVSSLTTNKKTDVGSETRRSMVTTSENIAICLQEADIFRICETAIELEKIFCSQQDIEWAMCKGKLHILQARPITALDLEADEDLIHEFDSPIVGERELITTSNIQEMMPGAVSTLTGDLFISAADRAVNYNGDSRLGIKQPVHALRTILTMSGLSFFNVTSCANANVNGLGGDKAKFDTEIHLVGQSVEEHDIKAVHDFFGRKPTFWQKTKRVCREFITLRNRDSKLFENLKDRSETFSIDVNAETAAILYGRISENLMFYYEMWRGYIFKASESSIWAGIIMAIFKGNAKDMSVENLADMALILSECTNVISAQVPVAIHNLAKQIAESDFKEQFLNMPTEECSSFLKNSSIEKLKSDYKAFMEEHGHRGIREAELAEKSWSQDPRELMETVKLIVRQGTFQEKERRSRTIDEIVDSLQTQLTGIQKVILKRFLVQAAMKGVASRELGKSYIVKVTEIFKRAYWRLADMMVSESRLPEQKLLFFLTHREIGELLEHCSARLVRLAKKRKRILPEMNKIRYPKINFGLPQPVNEENETENRDPKFILRGMPVCRGKAEGRACVIKTLQDANQLEEDDVLICKFTDVGWSLYFPLISGLVTELGGLLSHGAVVARECGIPCIVNTPRATDLIQTGDCVVLNGTTGTIKKL